MHRAVIKHEISSALNTLAQSSGLSLNNKKSFKTETFANSSADTLDRQLFQTKLQQSNLGSRRQPISNLNRKPQYKALRPTGEKQTRKKLLFLAVSRFDDTAV